jgi:ubiquinone/menaquinone biosynthesis C-methylase UbiE
VICEVRTTFFDFARRVWKRTKKSMPVQSPAADNVMMDCNAASFEQKYVYDVYESIAPHFSHTRKTLWPGVVRFLRSCARKGPHTVLDVGCGNGKYLWGVSEGKKEKESLSKGLIVGVDVSAKLVRLTQSKATSRSGSSSSGIQPELCVCDNLRLPFRGQLFDYALSVAVIHHLATEERRIQAVREILRVLRPGGSLLVYVWSFEQGGRVKGKAPASQDALVRWNMPMRFSRSTTPHNPSSSSPSGQGQVQGSFNAEQREYEFLRYYRLFKEGELEKLLDKVPGCDLHSSGLELQNWWAIVTKHVN